MALSTGEQHAESPLTVPSINMMHCMNLQMPCSLPQGEDNLSTLLLMLHMDILVHLEDAYVSVLSTECHLLRCSLLCAVDHQSPLIIPSAWLPCSESS